MNNYYHRIGALPHERRLWVTYVLGFVGSIVATLDAYILVQGHALAQPYAVGILVALALAQIALQTLCFLHIAQERGHARTLMLGFGLLVVTILVSGSLWIMNDLSGRMMDTSQMRSYMQGEGGF